jgi:hypothetical protein
MVVEPVVVQTIGMAAAAMADPVAEARRQAHQQIRARVQQDKVTIAVHETATDPDPVVVAQVVQVVQLPVAVQVVLVYKQIFFLEVPHIMQVVAEVLKYLVVPAAPVAVAIKTVPALPIPAVAVAVAAVVLVAGVL